VVGGLPVTCNLTLPVACVSKARSNGALPAGQPRSNSSTASTTAGRGQGILDAGRIQAAYMLAPLVMDLADRKYL